MFEKHMCLFIILASVLATILLLSHYNPALQVHLEGDQSKRSTSNLQNADDASSFDADVIGRNFTLNLFYGRDVIVLLHIQKTAGSTFGRHLVRNLNLTHPCVCHRQRKRCDCKTARNQHWMFGRFSTGWSCGVHADWTELNECVDDKLNRIERRRRIRRYSYVTMLRDPIYRYLSEWKHVQKGNSWTSAKLRCDGRQATLHEVPFCFSGDSWAGVTLDEFMSCPHNLGNNRQTRMLANLSLVGCYNTSHMSPAKRSEILLESAKTNLRNMAYFGLTEFQSDSQFLFEETFHINFKRDFTQHHNTSASRVDISEDVRRRITELNSLDVELYNYAKKLFFVRVQHFSRSLNDSLANSA